MNTATEKQQPVSIPPSDGSDDSIISELEYLCCRVAALDDAGLDVFAKRCIADAKKLVKRIKKGE